SQEDLKSDQAAAREEKRNESAAAIAEWKTRRVSLIFRDGNKVSAVIGDQLVHEGDVIQGVRVISILPNGVLVAPAAPD
ncbi:MAG: hypothetical protein JWN70_2128, partial [Planctomycetaceae bacterium]|nr:hypothetical protein [Planctomycetaceae bacterium]